MDYTSVNELDKFSFHDGTVKKIQRSGSDLIWNVEVINATKNNSQNTHPKDMGISKAIITFENCLIEQILYSGYSKMMKKDGKRIDEIIEPRVANLEEFDELLSGLEESYCFINSMENYKEISTNEFTACFFISGKASWEFGLYVTLSFSKCIIEWDDYFGKAWYEDFNEKLKKY